jgi:hypothetical protein
MVATNGGKCSGLILASSQQVLSGFFICILMTSITAVSVGLASSSLEKPGHEVGRQLYGADLAQPTAQVAHQVGAVQAECQKAQQQPTKLQAKHIVC